jgi:acetaldehyde dehydrogenase (acetylating)
MHSWPLLVPLLAQKKEKVAIIGSGNWGSAIAKVVGRNLLKLDGFEKEVCVPACAEDSGAPHVV